MQTCQDLNDRTKQNYYCIPNIFGEKDKNGYAKTFIAISVNREYGTVFASSMDVIAGYMDGEENPTNGYMETVKSNFLPQNPVTDNVLAPIFSNLPQNKDFAGRKIVPTNMEDLSPEYQYDYSTSGLAKGIAKVANNLHVPSDTLKSPMKVDYLLDSYTGYLGQLGQAATAQGVDSVADKIKGVTIDPFIDRFTKDSRYSSGVVSDFYDKKELADRAYNDAKFTTGEKDDRYVTYKVYSDVQKELSDISAQEKDILSGSLSADEKSKQVKELREKRNEIARGAEKRVEEALKEYDKNPNYAVLDKDQKESYEKNYKSLGVSKEDYAAAKSATSGLTTDASKAYAIIEKTGSKSLAAKMTSENAVETVETMKKAGITVKQMTDAQKVISESGYTKAVSKAYVLMENGSGKELTQMLTSENAYKKATWCKKANVTPDMLNEAAKGIDPKGNYTVDKIKAYFSKTSGYTTAQKRAIFLALSRSENSPY